MPSRRAFLLAGAGAVVLGAGAAAGVETGVLPRPGALRRLFADTGQPGTVPAVPQGQVRLEQVTSAARGRRVGLWSAVPDGMGAGAGLPVCLVLHGASATTADYTRFGLARFLTAAVRDGVPPFVLVGADGGGTGWQRRGDDDPQRMLREEMPAWCAQRGWDAARMSAFGWSLGGRGALLLAEQQPDLLRSVSALSPAVSHDDVVVRDAPSRLHGPQVALWCGTADALLPNVRRLAAAIRGGPAVASYAPGAHTRGYWNTVTPAAYAFSGHALAVAVGPTGGVGTSGPSPTSAG